MSDSNYLTRYAIELLKGDVAYLLDAQQGAPVGNSVVGSVMAITLGIPRQISEKAVRDALRLLDQQYRALDAFNGE